MTKELAREVSGFYLSSPCEVWWIAESVLNVSRSRADGTTSSWLLYFRHCTNFHTVIYIIWTPLWTKCARAAAILSNISADHEIDFYFIWQNWIQTLKQMFPWKKYLISLKAPELWRNTYFQIKVNKSGKFHYLGPGWVPWGNFRGNHSCWGSIFMLFRYFVYIAHFTKFTPGSSLFMEKSLLMEKINSKVLGRKEEKKAGPKKKEYHSFK